MRETKILNYFMTDSIQNCKANKACLSLGMKRSLGLMLLACTVLMGCTNSVEDAAVETNGALAGDDRLMVSACIAGGASRHAMPAMAPSEFAYGALLYPGGSADTGGFSSGIVGTDGASVAFSFQKPSAQDGLTLELFAFAQGTEEADFSENGAILCGKKTGLAIQDGRIETEITLLPNTSASAPKGAVSLKVKAPGGHMLEICETNEDGTPVAETHFIFKDGSPDDSNIYTITQKDADSIAAGAYNLHLTLKKDGLALHVLTETVNVFPGMVTDTWSGLSQGEAREVTQAMLSATVYVRGAGGWYDGSADFKDTAAASDDNPGSLMRPFATIQKAVDTIIARNDRSSAYTILVDGTLTYDGSNTNGMADFSALDKNLNLTIKPLSSTGKATLDANQKSRVIYAKPNVTRGAPLSLTLESLVITGGNTTTGGGGIYIRNGTCIVTDCEISGNTASNNGGGVCVEHNGRFRSFTMNGGKISGNTSTTGRGGGIYSYYGDVIMNDGEISHNTAGDDFYGGGGVYVNQGEFEMKGGKIIHNTAKSGGGVNCQDSTFIMSGAAEISDNTASNGSGGGFAGSSYFTMRDEAKITNNKALNGSGGGVYNTMGCKITGGEISGNEAKKGGGVYLAARGSSNPKTTMTGGTVSGNTATDAGGGVYVSIAAGDSNTLTMDGTAEVSGNTTTGSGGGIYVENKCALNMNAGSISGNSATENGGGVYVVGEDRRFTMSGGTLNGNTAANGGGVYIATSNTAKNPESAEDTFLMEGGEVSRNEASGNGGGFYVSGKGRRFRLAGGTVSGNIATENGGGVYADESYPTLAGGEVRANTAARGGGIYINMSTLDMTGGTVGGNTATFGGSGGSGIFVSFSTLNLSGGALVEDGNDVFYISNTSNTLNVAGDLTQPKVATITPAGYTAGKEILAAAADSSVTITPDICDKFAITPLSDGAEWKIVPSEDGTTGVLLKAQ